MLPPNGMICNVHGASTSLSYPLSDMESFQSNKREWAKEASLPPPAASSSGSGAPASGWHLPSPGSPGQDSRHPGISATSTHSGQQRCGFKSCDGPKAPTFGTEGLWKLAGQMDVLYLQDGPTSAASPRTFVSVSGSVHLLWGRHRQKWQRRDE